MRYFLAVLLLAGAAFAQCPISIEKVNPFPVEYGGHGMKIVYRNTGEKTIRAAEFGAIFYDAVDDRHPSLDKYIIRGKVEPGKTGSGTFKSPWSHSNEAKNGAEGYLMKILYEDGSSWSWSKEGMQDREKAEKYPCLTADNIRKKQPDGSK